MTRAVFLLAALIGCHRAPKLAGTYDLPTAVGPIVLDGNCAEASWHNSFRSPLFQDSQGHTAPHTELRATADDANLYLCIYVGDIDIRSTGDKVQLDIGTLRVVVTPKGGTAPPGVRLETATDDSIDNPKDFDEEWVSEVSVPWSLLGGHEATLRAFRVDVGNNEPPHGLAWPPYAPALVRFQAR